MAFMKRTAVKCCSLALCSTSMRWTCPRVKTMYFIPICLLVMSSSYTNGKCRERSGRNLTDLEYKHTTCALCYSYLIKENIHFKLQLGCGSNHNSICLKSLLNNSCFCPDIEKFTTVEHICTTVSTKKCQQWTKCCQDAWDCCSFQKSRNVSTTDGATCPDTWDGWECWKESSAGTTAQNECPNFLQTDPEAKAKKNCTSEGKWWRTPGTGDEHTDYNDCLSTEWLQKKIQFEKDVTIVRLTFNSAGILLLCFSLVVFLNYRQLRSQQRIRLHIHLFLSLLTSGIIELFWDVLIRYRQIQGGDFLGEVGCKLLYVLNRFGWSAPFFWMLCEGFYLHKLLVKAFESQKSLLFYYVFGWGTPVLLTAIYTVLKITNSHDSKCWLTSHQTDDSTNLYWIIFAPTILCLLLNVIFFINILRILLKQVRMLPSEPSNFRKAIKASFILIPLFGFHQFFLIYQPTYGHKGYSFFQIAGGIINNSQGIIVSLIFCILNGEVLSYLKASYTAKRLEHNIGRRKSLSSQTNTRRFSASSINNTRRLSASSVALSVPSALPHVSSYKDISDTLNLTENNNIPMEERPANGVVNGGFMPYDNEIN